MIGQLVNSSVESGRLTTSGVILDLRSEFRELGVAGALVYFLDRALARLLGGNSSLLALRYYLQPLPKDRIVAIRENDPVRVGPISEAYIDPSAFGRPIDAIHERFREGSICIAAIRNEELLGFMWLQRGVLKERLVRCDMQLKPESRVMWDYDFFIQPRHRMGRLFGKLWDGAAETLRTEGVEATVSWIRVGNLVSEQAHSRLGAKRIGWAVFLTIRGRQTMISSFKPYLSFAGMNSTSALTINVEDLL